MIVRRRLPRLSPDPDARINRGIWVLWCAGAAVLAWLTWGGAANEMLPLLAPLTAGLLLWPLYRAGRAIWQWTRWRAHADWHGNYFEFNDRQIRVLFAGEQVSVVAADVFDVLGIDAAGRVPQRVRGITGRDGLTTAPDTSLLVFTERGLAAWMERRTDGDASRFARWFKAEVTDPYRKRRALEMGESGAEAQVEQ